MASQDFVQLPIETNEQTLADNALVALEAAWPGWVANDGDPEVILVEALAPLAGNAAQVAADMPAAALRALGTKLLGIPYQAGMAATTNVQSTVQDAAGYTIPAGVQINIDGYAFNLINDLVIPAGNTTGVGTVASADFTTAANGLTGATILQGLTVPAFVTGMAVQGATAGGVDPQTDEDYTGMVSADRRLNSRAIISLLDFELAALEVQGVARAHADTTSARAVTLTLTDPNGQPTTAAVKATVQSKVNPSAGNRRLVNITVTIADSTYTVVNVTYTVAAESGFDPADLVSRINTRLQQYLSPLGYGVPTFGDPGSGSTTWINRPTVYLNDIIGLIKGVGGVLRVVSVALNGQAADLALPGTVPLPNPGVMTGSVQ